MNMGDEPDYRALAQTLLRQKNLLLEGVPGTGKTYAVSKIVDELRSHLADAESDPRGVGGDGAGDFAVDVAVAVHQADAFDFGADLDDLQRAFDFQILGD